MPSKASNPFQPRPTADAGTTAGPVRPDVDERPPVTARGVTLGVSFLATVLLACGLAVVPSPYVVRSPGPTVDTLGSVDGESLIAVDGAETYDSTGELRLTTVGVIGGPAYPLTIAHVVRGWFDGKNAVAPEESAFPRGITREEADRRSDLDMVESQRSAAFAALDELGYDIPVEVVVQGVVDGSPATGLLDEGDVLLSVDGTPVARQSTLFDVLDATEPGRTITVEAQRGDEVVTQDVVTMAPEPAADGTTPEGSRLGILVSSSFELPVDVSIAIDDIGGPSAGTMFALGIIDLLTPEDEAAGQVIAGTGTMDMEGTVGAIGGIRQKLHGALRDGATWFLAPAANCGEVYDNVPVGLRVVKVETLAEARAAMVAIGAGTGADLPTCTKEDVAAAQAR